MRSVVWVSGASSGIGAAVANVGLKGRDARVIGISRREHPGIENFTADLSDLASWKRVGRHFRQVLASDEATEAIFVHCAGTLAATGPLGETDSEEYTRSVLLNAASGQVLGRSFLLATSERGVPATLVMCSSPAASDPLPDMSHYCAGKAALEHWTRSVAAEVADDDAPPRVFAVVPYAVDTPMVRGMMEGSASDTPLAGFFRSAAAKNALATPDGVAREIWAGIDGNLPSGTILEVGAKDLDPSSLA